MKIRVLFFEPYPMGLGGNFVTQRLILERLDRSRFEPMVVAPINGIALDRFRSMGVECLVVQPPQAVGSYGGAALRTGVLGRLQSVAALIAYNLRLMRLLRSRRIDVVYSNCVRAQLSVGLAARLAGVPSLLYVKGELANPLIDRLCFLLADKLLFFCAANRDDNYPRWVRWFDKKIGILPIGLEPATIDGVLGRDHVALRRELGIDCQRFNVVVLGQLYRPKGQHFAVEALSRVVEYFPNAYLYIVGDHVLEVYRSFKGELEKLIERHGLGANVCFTGWRLDALDIVSQMDLVIHPSLAEGFGRAVLESMALGKPVVASSVGGLREAIQDGRNGYLVVPGDVEGIARRWLELMSSQMLREQLGQEARRTVLTDYMIDDKVTRLAEIWTEMAAGRR